MNHRMKTKLLAPDGVEESIIEGTYYWPDEDGHIETTNGVHVAILKRHGYAVVSEVSVMQPATTKGPIEVDELGRAQLAAALTERGLSFPADAPRADLAEIADGWNQARRRSRLSRVEADAPAAAEPQAPEPAAAAPASDQQPDFSQASYDDLKGWLTAHGVAFPPNTAKKKLQEMAETAYAELIAKKAKAA